MVRSLTYDTTANPQTLTLNSTHTNPTDPNLRALEIVG